MWYFITTVQAISKSKESSKWAPKMKKNLLVIKKYSFSLSPIYTREVDQKKNKLEEEKRMIHRSYALW
jgi:hypothetical protein